MDTSKSPFSASSMEKFVRKLFCETEDLNTLTQRIVRQKYMQHAQVTSINVEAKTLLKQIVQIHVEEIQQGKDAGSRKDAEETGAGAGGGKLDDKENGASPQLKNKVANNGVKQAKSGSPTRFSCRRPLRSPLATKSPGKILKTGSTRIPSRSPEEERAGGKKQKKKKRLSVEQVRQAVMNTPQKSPQKTKEGEVPETVGQTEGDEPVEEQSPISESKSSDQKKKKKWQRVSSMEVRNALMASDLSGVSELDSDSEPEDKEVGSPSKRASSVTEKRTTKGEEEDEENWKPFTPVKGAERYSGSEAESEELSAFKHAPREETTDADTPIKLTKKKRQVSRSNNRRAVVISDSDDGEKSSDDGDEVSSDAASKKKKPGTPRGKQKKDNLDGKKLKGNCFVGMEDCSYDSAEPKGSKESDSEDEVSMKQNLKGSPKTKKRKRVSCSSSEGEDFTSLKMNTKKTASKRQKKEVNSDSDEDDDWKPETKPPQKLKLKTSRTKAAATERDPVEKTPEKLTPHKELAATNGAILIDSEEEASPKKEESEDEASPKLGDPSASEKSSSGEETPLKGNRRSDNEGSMSDDVPQNCDSPLEVLDSSSELEVYSPRKQTRKKKSATETVRRGLSCHSAEKKLVSEGSAESSSEDEDNHTPLRRKKISKKSISKKNSSSESSDEEAPLKKKQPAASRNKSRADSASESPSDGGSDSEALESPKPTQKGISKKKQLRNKSSGSKTSSGTRERIVLSDSSSISSPEVSPVKKIQKKKMISPKLVISKRKKISPKPVFSRMKSHDCTSSESSSDDEAHLKKKTVSHKPVASRKKSNEDISSGSPSSEDDEGPLKGNKISPKPVVSRKKSNQGNSSESSSEDESPQKKKEKSRSSSVSASEDSDSDVPEKQPEKSKKSSKKRKRESSSDQGEKRSRAPAKKKTVDRTNSRLMHLQKIARVAGVMPVGRKITELYEGCRNANDKVKRIKRVLRDAGMEGPPSMEWAESMKLQKEARELDTSNIISSEGRGRRRNVFSVYATQQTRSPVRKSTPPKCGFRRLQGIMDSEDSD